MIVQVGLERELMLRSHSTFDFWLVMPMKMALSQLEKNFIMEVVLYTCRKNKNWNDLAT